MLLVVVVKSRFMRNWNAHRALPNFKELFENVLDGVAFRPNKRGDLNRVPLCTDHHD